MIGYDLHVFWYLLVLLRADLQLGALAIAVTAFMLALCGSLARWRATHQTRSAPSVLAFPAQRTDERRAA